MGKWKEVDGVSEDDGLAELPTVRYGSNKMNRNKILARVNGVRSIGNVVKPVIQRHLTGSELRQKVVTLDPILFVFAVVQQRLLGFALYFDLGL